ncbi:MAG: hypothetical protein V4515_06505 [Chloroflexota bacterium]
MIEATAWGVGVGVLSVFLMGVRRLPWRYAGLAGLGYGVVFTALRMATADPGFDPGLLILFGALGGSLATIGAERGERARVRRSVDLLESRPSSPG